MAELIKISDLSIPAFAILKEEKAYEQFPIWRESVINAMKLNKVYFEFVALEENPVLSELIEETRVAMDEARDSLAREPANAAREAILSSITAKYDKLKKSIEAETSDAHSTIEKREVIAKGILLKSTTIAAYLKFTKSAWSLWRKILSDHRVKAEAFVEDLKRELEYLVLNNNESVTAWQGRVEELCAQIEYHGGDAVPRRRIVGRILKEATNVLKHLAWATDRRLVALKARYDNHEVVTLEEAWNLLKTLELEYPGKREAVNSVSPHVLSIQQEPSVATFQSLLEKLERQLEVLQLSGRAQTATPATVSTNPRKTSKPKRTPPPGCPKGVCYSYWESGVCSNGAACKYIHERASTAGTARAVTTETTGYVFSVRQHYLADEISVPFNNETEQDGIGPEEEDEPLPTNFSTLRYIDEVEDSDLREWAEGLEFPDDDGTQSIDHEWVIDPWEDGLFDHPSAQLTHPSSRLKRLYSGLQPPSVGNQYLHDSIEPELKKYNASFDFYEDTVAQINKNPLPLCGTAFTTVRDHHCDKPTEIVGGNDFILDSGCTAHLIRSAELLTSSQSGAFIPITLLQADGSRIHTSASGGVGCLEPVGVVTDLANNLCSMGLLVQGGREWRLNESGAFLIDKNTGKIVLEGSYVPIPGLKTGIWTLPYQRLTEGKALSGIQTQTYDLIHSRLCHLSGSSIRSIIKAELVSGINITLNDTLQSSLRTSCASAKSSRKPFHGKPFSDVSNPGEVVGMDLCGPMRTMSLGGSRYFLLIIDFFTEKWFFYPIANKSDALSRVRRCISDQFTPMGYSVKTFFSDQGGEFTSHEFRDFARSIGARQLFTVGHAPESNGKVERANRTIVELATSLLIASTMPKSLWADASATVVHVMNRVRNVRGMNKSPEELWTGAKPKVAHLRAWGCLAMVHIEDKRLQTKFNRKAVPGRFIGYSEVTRGYRVAILPHLREVVESRNVTFDEASVLPGGRYHPDHYAGHHTRNTSEDTGEEAVIEPSEDIPIPSMEDRRPPERTASESGAAPFAAADDEDDPDLPPLLGDDEDEAPAIAAENNLGENHRHLTADPGAAGITRPVTRSCTGSLPAPKNVLTSDVLGEVHNSYFVINDLDFSVCLSTLAEIRPGDADTPSSYREAVSGPQKEKWIASIHSEWQSMVDNDVFEPVDPASLPASPRALDTKYIFRTKRDKDGNISKLKTRLTLRGFRQLPTIDYGETFAAVPKATTFRLFFIIAVQHQMDLQQMDVKTAFLYGVIDRELYVKMPEGFHDFIKVPKHFLLKLKRSIYGLKQASRIWYELLAELLIGSGLIRSYVDNCLFFKYNSNGQIALLVLVHVDDLMIAGVSSSEIQCLKSVLKDRFQMDDIGRLEFCLGIHVDRTTDNHLHLHQRKYIEDLVTRFDVHDAPVTTPADPSVSLDSYLKVPDTDDIEFAKTHNIKSLVGCLLYAAIWTRYDILFAVITLTRYMEKPSRSVWNAGIRILRYLKGTATHGPRFSPTASTFKLEEYSDASFGTIPENSRSVSSFAIRLGTNLVSWRVKCQTVVAMSSCEAEAIAVADTIKENDYIVSLIESLKFSFTEVPVIHVDNQAAFEVSKNPVHHGRMRHLMRTVHFIQDAVQTKRIAPMWIRTENMLADIGTKALSTTVFERLRRCCGIIGLFEEEA